MNTARLHQVGPGALPPERAFVIQLRLGSDLTPDGMTGRVEHVLSGQATSFVGLPALLAFIEQISRCEGGG